MGCNARYVTANGGKKMPGHGGSVWWEWGIEEFMKEDEPSGKSGEATQRQSPDVPSA